MTCKEESGFNVSLKLLIDTNKKAELSDEWKKKIGFEFEKGLIVLTLPLNVCVSKAFEES